MVQTYEVFCEKDIKDEVKNKSDLTATTAKEGGGEHLIRWPNPRVFTGAFFVFSVVSQQTRYTFL